jgi:hypothetical protein
VVGFLTGIAVVMVGGIEWRHRHAPQLGVGMVVVNEGRGRRDPEYGYLCMVWDAR